jgi:MFS family permease
MSEEEHTQPEEDLKKNSPLKYFKFYGSVLKNRDYLNLWIGSIVSNIGNRIHFIALMVFVYNITGKALDLGLLMIVMAIPNFLLSPLMGVLADRMDKRILMIISDVARALIVVLFPFTTSLWQVYVLSFLMGAANSAFFPSLFALIPRIVSKKNLLTANSLNTTTQNVVAIIGPAAGGLIVGYWGTTPAFLFNSLTFIFSAFMIYLISKPEKKPDIETELQRGISSYVNQFREGMKFMLKDQMMRYVIFVFAVLILVTSGLNPLFIVLTKEVLGKGEVAFGYLISALGVGGIFGGFIYGLIGHKYSRISMIVNFLLLDAIVVIALGFNTNYYIALALFAIFGIIGTVFHINVITLCQEYIPEDKMGRAMGLFSVMFDPLSMLSMGLFGYLTDLFGIGLIFIASGTLEFFAVLLARILPVYKRVSKLEPTVKIG